MIEIVRMNSLVNGSMRESDQYGPASSVKFAFEVYSYAEKTSVGIFHFLIGSIVQAYLIVFFF